MAGLPGKDQTFSLDNSSGTPVDLSAHFTSIDAPVEWGLEDTTTLGDSFHESTPTLGGGSFSIGVIWNATVEAHITSLLGLSATSTFTYGPNGTTSGRRRRTGECRVENWQVGGEVAGIVTATVNLRCDGTITFDTF